MSYNKVSNETAKFVRGIIAEFAQTEEEAHSIVQILAETEWTPLIELAQTATKRQEEHQETQKKLRQAWIEKHKNDPVPCQSCDKIFPRHQLELPTINLKGYQREIPKRVNKPCCPDCREAIRKKYTGICKICGKEYIANNSQQTCRKCCWKDLKYISRQVKTQLARARKKKLPATLTVHQWQATLDHFQGLCAYCRRRSAEELDHFIPIDLGGGTTWDNCVPICERCNKIKTSHNLGDYSELIHVNPSIKPEVIEGIHKYLSDRNQIQN